VARQAEGLFHESCHRHVPLVPHAFTQFDVDRISHVDRQDLRELLGQHDAVLGDGPERSPVGMQQLSKLTRGRIARDHAVAITMTSEKAHRDLA
jgi:hypothetical protein